MRTYPYILFGRLLSYDNIVIWKGYWKKLNTKVHIKQYCDPFSTAERAQTAFRDMMAMLAVHRWRVWLCSADGCPSASRLFARLVLHVLVS
jgi:hypothetical protein